MSHDPSLHDHSNVDVDMTRIELMDQARQPCHCSGFRCISHLAADELERKRERRVAVIGMRHLTASLNQAYAELTADAAIVLGMFDGVWEGEGPSDGNRLFMHKARIDAADEVYIVNPDGQLDQLVAEAIEHAELTGKPIRWLESPADLCKVCEQPMVVDDVVRSRGLVDGGYAHLDCHPAR